ncbi:hypothetical protein O4H49_16450 [Kiloniella laminariae]|uniref:HTH iclR-type domain-containing protein n=1 Tax=Kiloniella laminariae TaxID=454162 RepID=A0ABT4LMN9_9PROT|nr:hypothetical protein [Kiloniella laminariae]MCZ4282379.1 hypothetical protein [Kiloniella laminariae]
MNQNFTPEMERRVRHVLETIARQQTIISYRQLALEAEIPGPQVIHRLTQILESILRQDHAEGEISFASLAVSRGDPAIPRAGFFLLLKELGQYQGSDQGEDAKAHHHKLVALAYKKATTRP